LREKYPESLEREYDPDRLITGVNGSRSHHYEKKEGGVLTRLD